MLCCVFVVVVCCYVETVRKAHSAQSFLQEAAYPLHVFFRFYRNMLLLRLLLLTFALAHGTSAKPLTISCLPNSRFTMVSPRIIRIEYVVDPVRQRFEDRSSTAFAHRVSLPMSAVNVENRTTEWCNVSVNIAPYLELSFRKSPQLHNAAVAGDDKATAYFKQHQLSISSRNTNGIAFSWKIGMDASNNLLGTLGLSNNTLAGTNTSGPDLRGCCTNPNYPQTFDPSYELQNGLISRDGWSLVDDSFTELVDNGTGDFDEGWISSKGRQEDSADWYFFGCGLEYAACLEEFVSVSGRISAPTKHALGVWWSRHWGGKHGYYLSSTSNFANIILIYNNCRPF